MVGTAETVRLAREQVAKFVIGKNEMRRLLVDEVRLQSWKKQKLEVLSHFAQPRTLLLFRTGFSRSAFVDFSSQPHHSSVQIR